MNNINLLGRLTNTSEFKKSVNGHGYTRFAVAVLRQDNPRQEADYIRCMAFDKPAAAIHKHCVKGRQVPCQGRPQVSTSINEVIGQVKYHHIVVVSTTRSLYDPNVPSPSV